VQGIVIPIAMGSGSSFIHRINPLAKLIWVIGIMIFSFSTRNPVILFGLTLLGLVLVWIAGIQRPFFRVMLILFPISASLIVFQSLAPAFPRPWTPIAELGPFTIYQEGIYSGLSLLARALVMTVWALVALMTTHPSDLFVSLQRIGMPYVLNFMLTMTLQLIPLLQREFSIVLSAQKSRGMKSTGFGALLPSMVPVFAGAIERVQQLSISLESRAFGSSGVKTSYRQISTRPTDYVIGAAGILFTVVGVGAMILTGGLDWSQTLIFPPIVAIMLVLLATAIFIAFTATAILVVIRA